ncbi:hypothetical protein N7501_010589 [Penicillium viridicatum]|nr:hypothetical protein N7501_010589 [Penicillium viridicatum]
MTPTPPPSNPIDPVSKSQKSYTYKPSRYPLPTRSPLEVCLDSGLYSDARTTRYKPEDLGRTTFTNLQSTEDIDSTIIPDNVYLGAEYRSSGFGSYNLDPTVLTSQYFLGNKAIDPAILDDHAFLGRRDIQRTVPPGLIKGPIIVAVFRLLLFVLNSRPFPSRTG